MNAYEVLKDHHVVIKGLGRKISEAPVNSEERHALFDDMLIELDIHFRIEDDLYYPALAAATKLIAVAHAEHRQVIDQLSVLLKTPQTAPGYTDDMEFVQDGARGPRRRRGARHDSRSAGGEDHRRRAQGAGQQDERQNRAVPRFRAAPAAYQGARRAGARSVTRVPSASSLTLREGRTAARRVAG